MVLGLEDVPGLEDVLEDVPEDVPEDRVITDDLADGDGLFTATAARHPTETALKTTTHRWSRALGCWSCIPTAMASCGVRAITIRENGPIPLCPER